MQYLPLLILVGVIVLAISFALWGMRVALIVGFNSAVGYFSLYAVRLVVPTLLINAWSVLLTAALGIVGLVVVLALHFMGAAF